MPSPLVRRCETKIGPDGRRSLAAAAAFLTGTLVNAQTNIDKLEMYLSQQLKAYRSGKRVHEVMSLMAKSLSDDDIADLSGWYASIKVDIREKP